MHVQRIVGRLASAHQGTLSAGTLSGIRLDRAILGYLHRSALEPLRNRVGSSFGSLQMRHDLVGTLSQRPGGDPPCISTLDARLRCDPNAIASANP
jgi:hypothetical protein